VEIVYRPAVEGDFEAQHRIFCDAEGAVVRARAYPWFDPPPEAMTPWFRHLLTHDGDRCWVAEDDGAVVGFTAAFVRDDTWFFSMLFVEPGAQGRGIGRALYDLAVRDAPARRLTIADSIQPISNAVYGRHGLLPIAPLLPMSGVGGRQRPADLEEGTPSAAELSRLDRLAYGFDRSVDHAFWQTRSQLRGWHRRGTLVAYAYRSSEGYIGPLAAIDSEAAAAALTAELADEGPVSIEIPATARPLLATALAAGLHINPPIGLLLASDGVPAPTALTIRSYASY
jgi:GNAT superfamily N-acetyltransferase